MASPISTMAHINPTTTPNPSHVNLPSTTSSASNTPNPRAITPTTPASSVASSAHPPPPPSVSSNSASTTTSAASSLDSRKRKRARPTVSCLECKRKKLKCDRLQPCQQCKNRRRPDLCTYSRWPQAHHGHPDAERIEADNVTTTDAAGHLVVDPSHHLHRLPDERVIPGIESLTVSEDQPPSTWLLGRTCAKGARSRYQGTNNRMSCLDYFPDAKNFIINGFKDADVVPMMEEIAVYQKSFHVKPRTPVLALPLADPDAIMNKMIDLLPSRAACDRYLDRYFSNWENILRVLHIPTFRRDYEEFWMTRQPSRLIPQLLGVITIMSCFKEAASPELLNPDVSLYCMLIQRWLDILSAKQRLDLPSLRARILLLIAKQCLFEPPTDLWRDSGALVRAAMVMGLHRDPSECEEFTFSEGEQRRKLWMTVVELDLQISMSMGMSTVVRPVDFNCQIPLNLNDAELDTDSMQGLDSSMADTTRWTQALPQRVLSLTLRQRLDATNLSSAIEIGSVVGELLKLATRLEEELKLIPHNLQPWGMQNDEIRKYPERLISQVMLDVYIRRSLIAIYRPMILGGISNFHPQVRRGSFISSRMVLSHSDAFDPTFADLSIINTEQYWTLFHIVCANDIMSAALMISYELKTLNTEQNALPLVAPHPAFGSYNGELGDRQVATLPQPNLPDSWTKHSLTRLVENTISSLIRRLGLFGNDLKEILPLSIVLQSVRSSGSTAEEQRELMRKGAERVLKACQSARPMAEVERLVALEKSPAVSQHANPTYQPWPLADFERLTTPASPPPQQVEALRYHNRMLPAPHKFAFGDGNLVGLASPFPFRA